MITPVPLGTWPTPLEAAPRLAARLGLAELWFKRDDLNGLGGGGNKIRKLQYTCAQAIAVGATTVITSGAPQSNHARLTAAAAARLGLSCVLVLAGSPPERRQGNLLLDGLAGAEIVWSGERPLAEVVAAEAERRSAYVIPFGGTAPASIQGYVDCGRELRAQLPDADGVEVVAALGSGGTMAGLVRELGVQRVIGVDVGAVPDPRATVAGLLVGEVEPDALRIDGTQVGAGYRTLTEAVRAALEVTARTEGVFLDPTYTGRAMAALLAGSFPHGDRVVFLHSGGLPGLFGHPEL
ncbi:D-cysteine desulfhydrase [Micromonospora noduli]|uniref:pyridoxal-phosphate dependent enzyme n=1 Tax=Micromonospora noduli TaxID=709876 RepID=UPI000DC00054|nr:pyridoxal-phosphate dependent enzyme [Micromonospora noduli]KAB1928968.1 pyridoxal-phosphate dependent enzyme [Micromonospora noduli]RAO31195.1 D-cysteine desulfhydrase [Micromonospora noduli]